MTSNHRGDNYLENFRNGVYDYNTEWGTIETAGRIGTELPLVFRATRVVI